MEVKIEGANPSARQIDLVPTEKFYQSETPPEPPKQEQSKKRRRGKRGKGAKPAAQEPKAAATAKPARKVVATEPKSPAPHARARPRRVVGPPDERRGFSKPVKVKAQKIYFGSWGEKPSATLQPSTKKSKRKRQRR
jgi:ribonuclease R